MAKPKTPAWPALNPLLKPRGWFKPFPNNPKDHPPEQVQQLRAIMDKNGWTFSILTDEAGEVIAGHGRLLAADLDPPIPELPAIIAEGWTAEQKRAYRLADNKISEGGKWDDLKLRGEMKALHITGFDMALTGFDLPTIQALTGAIAPLGGMPELPTGDKSPFEQITFTLHTSQVKDIRAAMKAADAMGSYGGSPNDNKNGNAIARVAKEFLKHRASKPKAKAKGKKK
jgi:hypothetical protein